jgi:hypothetical protein
MMDVRKWAGVNIGDLETLERKNCSLLWLCAQWKLHLHYDEQGYASKWQDKKCK